MDSSTSENIIEPSAFTRKSLSSEQKKHIADIVEQAGGTKNVKTVIPHINFHVPETRHDQASGYVIIFKDSVPAHQVIRNNLHTQTSVYDLDVPSGDVLKELGYDPDEMTRDQINRVFPATAVQDSLSLPVAQVVSRMVDEDNFVSVSKAGKMYDQGSDIVLTPAFDGNSSVKLCNLMDSKTRKMKQKLVVESGIPSLMDAALEYAKDQNMSSKEFIQSKMNDQLRTISQAKADLIAGSLMNHWGVDYKQNNRYMDTGMCVSVPPFRATPAYRTMTSSVKHHDPLTNQNGESLGPAASFFNNVIDTSDVLCRKGVVYDLMGSRGVIIMRPFTKEQLAYTNDPTVMDQNNEGWRNKFLNSYPAAEPFTYHESESSLPETRQDRDDYINIVSWCNKKCDANRFMHFPTADAMLEDPETCSTLNWNPRWTKTCAVCCAMKINKDHFKDYSLDEVMETNASIKHYKYSGKRTVRRSNADLDDLAGMEEDPSENSDRVIPTFSETVQAITKNWKNIRSLLKASGQEMSLKDVFSKELGPEHLHISSAVLDALRDVTTQDPESIFREDSMPTQIKHFAKQHRQLVKEVEK